MKASGVHTKSSATKRSRFWLVEASSMSLLSLGGAIGIALCGHAAPAPADDYPLQLRQAVSVTTLSDGAKTYVNDPYGFVVRQCVSFVGYRLRAGELPGFADTMTIHGRHITWGSAKHWDAAAEQAGFVVSSQPKVGAVAQWRAEEQSPTTTGMFTAGAAGHVGYVIGVDRHGWATVQQYDVGVADGYSVMKVRAPRYLYIAQ